MHRADAGAEEVAPPSAWEAAGRCPPSAGAAWAGVGLWEPPGPRRGCKGAVLVGPPTAPGAPSEAHAEGEAAPGGTPEALVPRATCFWCGRQPTSTDLVI